MADQHDEQQIGRRHALADARNRATNVFRRRAPGCRGCFGQDGDIGRIDLHPPVQDALEVRRPLLVLLGILLPAAGAGDDEGVALVRQSRLTAGQQMSASTNGRCGNTLIAAPNGDGAPTRRRVSSTIASNDQPLCQRSRRTLRAGGRHARFKGADHVCDDPLR